MHASLKKLNSHLFINSASSLPPSPKIVTKRLSWLPGLKTAVFSGKDVGGTCVNRGCVPSKALLAASGRVREMKDEHHLEGMGIKVQSVVGGTI